MNASTTTQNTETPIMPVFITACSAAAVWAAKIKQRLSALHKKVLVAPAFRVQLA